jgi:hypothetical protein
MIQHYPNATQVPDLQRPDPPAAVLQPVRVMSAGAGREKHAVRSPPVTACTWR